MNATSKSGSVAISLIALCTFGGHSFAQPWAAARANPSGPSVNCARAPQGPSFDCGSARTSVERAICASRDLSLQDRQVASLYGQLQRSVGNNPNHSAFATKEQREYIANRNRCGVRPQSLTACVQVAHENRIARLEELIAEIRSRP